MNYTVLIVDLAFASDPVTYRVPATSTYRGACSLALSMASYLSNHEFSTMDEYRRWPQVVIAVPEGTKIEGFAAALLVHQPTGRINVVCLPKEGISVKYLRRTMSSAFNDLAPNYRYTQSRKILVRKLEPEPKATECSVNGVGDTRHRLFDTRDEAIAYMETIPDQKLVAWEHYQYGASAAFAYTVPAFTSRHDITG